jgi:hypothetical protein
VKLWLGFPTSRATERGPAIRRRFLLLAVIVIAVLPLAWRGPSCGQDFDFHFENWLELTQSWHQGVFYPHWAASANYGAGEPRFVFYPPLGRFVGAILGSVLPWRWVPLAFTTLSLLGAGFSLRAMALEWFPEYSATLAACLYVTNPYMIFVMYERGALAELLAAAWLPMLVLYGLRRKPSVVPLAITIAALWLTDAPAGVMGSYALAILVPVATLQTRNGRLAARAAASVLLGLALTGFWLIPAVYEQRWVQIARATGPLMRVEDSFLFKFAKVSSLRPPVSLQNRLDLVYHNQVLGLASWIVLLLLLATALAGCISWKSRKAVWLPLVALSAVICALQFPWSDPIWQWAPELRFLQFPWRWMLVLGMIFAVFAGAALQLAPSSAAATRRAIRVRAAIILLLACGISVWAWQFCWQPCDEEDNVAAQIATFHDSGFAGTDEYTPRGAYNSQVQQGLPPVRVLNAPNADESYLPDDSSWRADPAAEVPARIVLSRSQSRRIVAQVTIARPAWAVFHLMDYPAWCVTRNGVEIQNHLRRPDGLMVIPLEAGLNRIVVRWRTTSDQEIGATLSLVGLAVTLALAFVERRKAQEVPLP